MSGAGRVRDVSVRYGPIMWGPDEASFPSASGFLVMVRVGNERALDGRPASGETTPRVHGRKPGKMGKQSRRRPSWDRVERVVRLLIAIANEVTKLSDAFHWPR